LIIAESVLLWENAEAAKKNRINAGMIRIDYENIISATIPPILFITDILFGIAGTKSIFATAIG
jgi:hypothetical protein